MIDLKGNTSSIAHGNTLMKYIIGLKVKKHGSKDICANARRKHRFSVIYRQETQSIMAVSPDGIWACIYLLGMIITGRCLKRFENQIL